jgi:hypothetical protein
VLNAVYLPGPDLCNAFPEPSSEVAALKVEVVHSNEFKLQQYNNAQVVELMKQSIIVFLLPMKQSTELGFSSAKLKMQY